MIDFFFDNKDIILPVLIGLFFVALGYYINYRVDTLRKNGIKTIGKVIKYEERHRGNSRFSKNIIDLSRDKIFYPIISFTDTNGKNREVLRDYGSYPKPFKKTPYDITIYYREKDGEIELTTKSILPDLIGMILLITGLVVIIFTIIDFI